jgi:bacterioferritin
MSRSAPNSAVIEVLNEVLTAELTAINQYFLHAKMCQSWGYARLAGYLRKESIDEMKHADAVIERILYLGGLPNLQRLWHLRIGETVPEQFTSDLALENEAIPRLQKGVEQLRSAGDVGSALLLEGILRAEEEHKDWLEMQLELIEQIGLQNYLAQQMHGG